MTQHYKYIYKTVKKLKVLHTFIELVTVLTLKSLVFLVIYFLKYKSSIFFTKEVSDLLGAYKTTG